MQSTTDLRGQAAKVLRAAAAELREYPERHTKQSFFRLADGSATIYDADGVVDLDATGGGTDRLTLLRYWPMDQTCSACAVGHMMLAGKKTLSLGDDALDEVIEFATGACDALVEAEELTTYGGIVAFNDQSSVTPAQVAEVMERAARELVL